LASAVFLRAVNVGGSSVFSPAALAKRLDLVNIGAAGTFVARRRVSAREIARELPFETDIVVRPGVEVTKLVAAGPPKVPPNVQLFVVVLVRSPRASPKLPFERPEGRNWFLRVVERRGAFVVCARRVEAQRGLDLSAIMQRSFGVPATARSWGTMVRVAEALSRL